jgi:hypothetical protein
LFEWKHQATLGFLPSQCQVSTCLEEEPDSLNHDNQENSLAECMIMLAVVVLLILLALEVIWEEPPLPFVYAVGH